MRKVGNGTNEAGGKKEGRLNKKTRKKKMEGNCLVCRWINKRSQRENEEEGKRGKGKIVSGS